MSQQNHWKSKLKDYVDQGLYADAEVFLENSLRTEKTGSEKEKIDKITQLIQVCYTRLRHDRAGHYADELQSLVGVTTNKWGLTLLLSYFICLSFIFSSSKKTFKFAKLYQLLIGKPRHELLWEQSNVLMFGNFWQSIRKSLSLSLYQYSLCQSQKELLLSVGFTAYSLSYIGHNFIGDRTLRRVVNKAKKLGEKEVVVRLNPHLAIAYGMSAHISKALSTYEEMEQLEDLPDFYRLVITANKIVLSLADISPADAQQAINLCLNESFSLANSANHVQIYGGQAIIYALTNRPEEAESFMHKSFLSAESCGGPLNYLFYFRMEALMWLILKNYEKCTQSINTANKHLKTYGGTRWHVQEIKRMECVKAIAGSDSLWLSKYYLHKFLLSSLLTFNFGLIAKGFKIYKKFLFSRTFGYWHETELVRFFQDYFETTHDTKTSHLGKISLKIASSFIDSYQSLSVFEEKGLEDQIRKTLPVKDVIFSNDKEAIIKAIQTKYQSSDLIVVSDKTDRIRIKCSDFGFYICVASPSVSSELALQDFFVGILIQDVDIQSEELIEAFLRVILTQYVFNSALIFEEKKRFDIEKRAATNQTIANTVQMLAHDVRRPFSMVQGVLDVLASTDDPKDAQEFAIEHLPEIKNAITSVTNMLSDVIEVGTSGKLEVQSISLRALVESILKEHFRYNETADVTIDYRYQHQHNLQVDATKVSRVMTNIVMNALQAMSFSGKLWFHSETQVKGNLTLIHIVIGNSGSHIPEAEIQKLFEPYYTKGKKSGTGLGLAIAHKIVNEHGGEIWCVSNEHTGTEFHFTLPADKALDEFEGLQFQHSTDIFSHYQPNKERELEPRGISEHEDENRYEQLAIKALKQIDWKFSILITDDEPFYRSILKEQILFNAEISECIDITLCPSGEQSLRMCEDNRFDLIIMDVDFGPAMINGFDTVREIRKREINTKTIIHSNRGALQYQAMSIEAGADLFIPKPMSRAVFLKIIVSVLQDMRGDGQTSLSA